MKRFALSAFTLLALSSAAFAGSDANLHSAATVTLQTLAPDLDTAGLTPIQVSRINSAVASDKGLSYSALLTIARG